MNQTRDANGRTEELSLAERLEINRNYFSTPEGRAQMEIALKKCHDSSEEIRVGYAIPWQKMYEPFTR